MKPAEEDCAARAAAARAAAEAARAAGTPPPPVPAPPAFTPPAPGSPIQPCSFRAGGNVLEGDLTIATLTTMFIRGAAGRHVVDKTGLTGYYRVRLEAARAAAGVTVDAAPDPNSTAPSIFTALPEQLGLKLEPSRAQLDALVIDRIERPTEN
jgi:uncharacterized protein (TIGR03435 family)